MRWLFLLALATTAHGRTWHVAPNGSDTAPGTPTEPLATATRAIALAAPGDIVELERGHYRGEIAVVGRSGEPGRPIIVEGNGSLIDGCDVIPPERIEAAGPGRWSFAATTMPELLVIDGQAAKQGRTQGSRGKPATLPELDQLQPGHWTWRDGRVVVRNDQPRPPALEVTVRESGVRMSGSASHFIFRNLTCRRFWNDGFNIHGWCRDLRFENIVGYENQDEGFSAHEWCECDVRNGEFYRNDNGIADVNRCQTRYHNVFTHDNLNVGLFFTGGRHWVDDSRSLNDGRPFHVGPGESLPGEAGGGLLATPDVVFQHFVAVSSPERPTTAMTMGRTVLRHATLVNCTVVVTAGMTRIERSILAGAAAVRRLTTPPGGLELVANVLQPGPVAVGPVLYEAGELERMATEQAWEGNLIADPGLDAEGRPGADSVAWKRPGKPDYAGALPSAASPVPGCGLEHPR